MKKKIFICSPYRGRVEENKKNAVSYARITAMSGDVPIVPHLYFPSFLDDNIPNERMTGIAMGLELMDMCDEVYEILGSLVYKPDGKVTLVPDSDKREAVKTATAEADFKED